MTRVATLPGLAPASYRAHTLHAPERIWAEKNCYTDLWIELLHAHGLDPVASLSFVFGLDFEGDQWTFFKPPLSDLRALYGVDVQELTVWRPVLEHALEHLGAGKWLALEVDAFWLPDTAATDYRSAHSKTTIVLNEVDTVARHLGYFHNAGYFTLDGEDFDQLFAPGPLPPYAELIRLDRMVLHGPAALRSRSRCLFQGHRTWRPASNPVRRFGERLQVELPALQAAGLPRYHRWAFAGVRQLGAASELAALYLRWLRLERTSDEAIEAFDNLAQLSKILLLKGARAVNSGRPVDFRPLLEEMAQAWDRGFAALGAVDRDAVVQ